MTDFNPKRLTFARKRRGLTLRALGDMVGLTSKTISDYENARRDPPEPKLSAIAEALNFPDRFFYLDDIKALDENSVSFRSFARMSASIRDAALHAGRIALEFSSWLDERFDLPAPDLPDLMNYEPGAAAKALRNIWGFGEKPIRNMVHLLEAKGVHVFSLAENTLDMDAFSFWVDDRPFIFLNKKKSVERSRFDAAHELGHLALHKHGSPQGKEIEGQANQFASEFLMPDSSVMAHAPRNPSLEWVFKAKLYWMVAASALVRRMKDLNLLTEWQYRSFIIELSKRGFMKNEPNPLTQRETSKLIQMVFRELRKENVTVEDIARDLGLFSDDINVLLFNLAIVGISGGKGNTSWPLRPSGERPDLKLVK